MKKSDDYHDYVIRGGTFIGEFEKMYLNSKEVPWRQDRTAFSLCTDIDLTVLAYFCERERWHRLVEVGCGYGYVAERLRTRLVDAEITGLDISRAAVSRARELFPDITFQVYDLGKPTQEDRLGRFDCVVVKDVLWYVLKDLDNFVVNVASLLRDGGSIYISQSVPDLQTFYGCEVFPDTFAIIDYFAKRYIELYSSSTYERTSVKINGIYERDKYARFLGKKVCR